MTLLDTERLKYYATVVLDSNDAIIIIDLQGKIKEWNKGAEKTYGYTAEEMIGKNIETIITKEHKKSAREQIRKIISGKPTFRAEQEIKTKTGKAIHVDITYTPIKEHGKITGIATTERDITEKKKAEGELKKEKEFSHSLLNTAQAIILLLDKKGRITYFNPYMEEISGYKLEEMQGRDWFSDLLPKRDRPRIKKLFLKSVGGIQTKGNINPIITKKGEEKLIEWYDKTIKDDQGQVAGILAIGQDVTEKKKTEEELKASGKTFEDLYETSTALNGTTDEILDKICNKVHELFDGYFVLINYAQEGEFHFKAGCNLPKVILKLGKEKIEGTICSHILENKKPLFTNELQNAKCPTCKTPYSKDSAVKAFGLNTYFGVPLVFSDNSVHGTLCILFKDKKEPFSHKETKILTLLGKRVAIELEREQNETRVRETEEHYKDIVEHTPEIVIETDLNGKVTYANPSALKTFNYSLKEVKGTSLIKYIHNNERQIAKKMLELGLSGSQKPIETTGTTKYGRELTILNNSSPIFKHGKLTGLTIFGQNITEEKKAEEEVKKSEEKYRSLYTSSADAIMTLEPPDWRFTAGNPATVKMFKCKNEKEFTSKAPYEWSPKYQPDGQTSATKALKMINKAMQEGTNFFEWVHRRATGEDFSATVLLTRLELGGKRFLQATVRDVSQIKKSEKELRKSEKTFRDLYETSTAITGTCDDVLKQLCKKVREIFDGFFVLVNYAKAEEFNFRAGCNLPKLILKLGRQPIKGTICSHVLENKKTLFTNELQKAKCQTCKEPYRNDALIKIFKLKTYFGIPLVFSDGRVRGTLCTVFKDRKEPFTPKEIEIYSVLAKRAAIELERDEEEKALKKRTQELQEAYDEIKAKNEELEKFAKFTAGREIKMIQLKKQVELLEKRNEKH
ncbi:Methyl sulfide methyltransferase-associated sensor [uncultured archaeon]|nr:Methyl sulfide methyltransferase-associated sensor [uncultured archaeon]